MLDDDHYIPNPNNAHIDTSDFEGRVRALLSDSDGELHARLECVYEEVLLRLSMTPGTPGVDSLICRYLSLPKFLDFLHTRRVHFPSAVRFEDRWESRVPEDYELAVLRVLGELSVPSEAWERVVTSRAARWRVSCWTQLEEHFDDHLMWSAYAGGSGGVGLTIRFGVLLESLMDSVPKIDGAGELRGGSVNYDSVCPPVFHKHRIFRNEKEVRFAFETKGPAETSVSVEDVFGSFGLRLSPAATAEHHEAMRRLWLAYGGTDRVNWHR